MEQFVPGHPPPSGVGQGRHAKLAGPSIDLVAKITGMPDLPTIARKVGPIDEMRGPPLEESGGACRKDGAIPCRGEGE